MKKKQFNLKTISANILLVCGIVTAITTTAAQIKDTFFKESEKVAAPAPIVAKQDPAAIITQTIVGAAADTIIDKTVRVRSSSEPVQLPADQQVTMSAAPEAKSYVWVFILVLAGGAIVGGFWLRKRNVEN